MACAVRSLRTKSIESREQSHPGFVYNTSDGLLVCSHHHLVLLILENHFVVTLTTS
jgi:hypothetical protein